MPAELEVHQLIRPARAAARSVCGVVWRARTWLHLPGIALGLWCARPTGLSVAIGAAVVVAGMLWRTWALGHIRKDETLCTTGPYSLVRHPLYLGNLVVLAGLLVVCRSAALAVGVLVATAALYAMVIRAEEQALAERFGDQWREYRARVPAVIPLPRRPTGKTDWRLALHNRVLLNWFLLAVVVGLLAAKPWLLRIAGVQ